MQHALLKVCFFALPKEPDENEAMGLERAKIWQTALYVIDSEHSGSLQSLSPSFQFCIPLECASIQPPCLPLGFSSTPLWARQPSTQPTFYSRVFCSSDSSSRKCCVPEWLVLTCSWLQNGHPFHLLETFCLLAPFLFCPLGRYALWCRDANLS